MKEKNQAKHIKLDAFSLDASFVSGRSEEIRSILIIELYVDWHFHGAQLELEDSERGADFWEVQVSEKQTCKQQPKTPQNHAEKTQTLL